MARYPDPLEQMDRVFNTFGNGWCKTEANWEEMRRILVEDCQFDFPDNNFSVIDIDGEIRTQDLGFAPSDMDDWMAFVAPFGNVREGVPWRDYMDISGLHVAQEALGLDLNPSADLQSGESKVANL